MGAPRLATRADLEACWDDVAVEFVNGEIVEKAAPTFEHGDIQSAAVSVVRGAFARRGGGGAPGGWWIASEVDIEIGSNVFRPDLAGWRRDRLAVRPAGRPVRERPDWVCEILSPSTARRDLVEKSRALQVAGVPHYWILDPEREVLTVYRNIGTAWVVALTAGAGEVVRAEPFDAIEMAVSVLFGHDPDGD